jgi:hypothetical protein
MSKSQTGFFGALSGFAGRAREAYRRRRTARIVANLPDYIRKDIGLYRDERDFDGR